MVINALSYAAGGEDADIIYSEPASPCAIKAAPVSSAQAPSVGSNVENSEGMLSEHFFFTI